MTMRTIKQSTTPTAPSASILAVPPDEAARIAGIGRTSLYAAISSGGLKSIKIGKRRLIAVEALRAWLLAREVSR